MFAKFKCSQEAHKEVKVQNSCEAYNKLRTTIMNKKSKLQLD